MFPRLPSIRSIRASAPQAVGLLIALGVLSACSSTPPTSTLSNRSVSFAWNPCSVTDTLSLSVAQTARVDCSNGGTTVALAGNGASYLVVPELATSVGFPTSSAAAAWVLYNVAASSWTSPPPSASLVASRARSRTGSPSAVALPSGIRSREAQQHAYDVLRARERQLLSGGAFQQMQARERAAIAQAYVRGPAGVSTITVPAQGSLRSFRVLANLNSGAYTSVGARLEYVGNSILLYVDTLAPGNGFTSTQLQQYGQYFDQTLYPIDTGAFGPPSDVDNNGHVIMLMSPVVNALTSATECNTVGFVAGFFNSEDFAGSQDANSNQGEIFYSIVPDPSGEYSCIHKVSDVSNVVPGTFLHELQHLIDFSTHVVIHGGTAEQGWLDEGLSIMAEELGSLYYENKCPPPSCRTDPTQLFPDSSQPFVSDFLYDSYEYGLLPDTAGITMHTDADDGFSWRGGAWALVHYLGDQFGPSVWRKLEDGSSVGIANIEAATGATFPQLFSDFGLALYTDSLPGLPRTTAPPADRFVTRNLRQMWARLYTTEGPANGIPYAMPIVLYSITSDTSSYVLDPGTATYYRLDTPDTSAVVTLQFSGPNGAKLPATLGPQLAIFRLPPGQ